MGLWICHECGATETNPKFVGSMENHDTDCLGRMTLAPTRDDLIRLVVGMQWVDACMAFHVLTSAMSSFGVSGDVVVTMDQELVDELRPAVDIVDEWLGVR